MADFSVKPKAEAADKIYVLENQDYIFSELLMDLTNEIKELRLAIARLSARIK
jgi:hypothetical protein